MADADRSRPDDPADPPPGAHDPADAAPADPPPGDIPPAPRIDRDPVAVAAWRRVAELRDRRRAAQEDVESADGADAPSGDAPDPGAAGGAPDPWAPSLPPPGFVHRRSSPRPDATRTEGPFGAPAEHGGPEPAGRLHDALLGLAGRLDDDALSSVRELVAVEDDAGGAELLGGCLLADAVALTPFERAVLTPWFGAARVDPGILELLPTDHDALSRVRHRFVAEGPAGPDGVGGADAGEVARAASRLPGVTAVGQCWRVTPAGATSGPVPHRVVVVQTEASVDAEHVAHHLAHAARDLGPASVEVVVIGSPLPTYHRDALAAAVPMYSPVSSRPLPAGEEEWRTVPDAAPTPTPDPGVVSESDLLLGELPFVDAGAASPPQPGIEGREDPPEASEDAAPGSLDPDEAAARIAALWRTPAPGDVPEEPGAAGDAPVASYDWGAGRPVTGSRTAAPEESEEAPTATRSDEVDPLPPGLGQVRRARSSRSLEGIEPQVRDAPVTSPATPVATTPAVEPEKVNGHRHDTVDGAQHDPPTGPDDDPPTEPVGWTSGQGIEVPRAPETGSTGAVGLPPGSAPGSGRPDDSVPQLSERERELLVRLHEELAARERAGSDLFETTGPTPRGSGPPVPDVTPPTAPLPAPGPGGPPDRVRGEVDGHGPPAHGLGDERED